VQSVTIVDYGAGNLLSVARALERCGATVNLADSSASLMRAERIVLPGVGAFADGMNGLQERNLVGPLRDFAASGKPMLGICLGMQMLMTQSEEFGTHSGLAIIEGNVVEIPGTTLHGAHQKIPHIGWNQLEYPKSVDSWNASILRTIREGEWVYLVHSFTAVPSNLSHRLADCRYGGRLICAALKSGNVSGCQFHPEKSGGVGLRIMKEFVETSVDKA